MSDKIVLVTGAGSGIGRAVVTGISPATGTASFLAGRRMAALRGDDRNCEYRSIGGAASRFD